MVAAPASEEPDPEPPVCAAVSPACAQSLSLVLPSDIVEGEDEGPLLAAGPDQYVQDEAQPEEVEAPGFAAVAEIAPRAGAQARRRKPRTDAAAKREHDQRMRRLRRDAETAERAAAAAEAEAEKTADAAAAARERAKQARRDARAATKALDAEERR